MDQTLQIPRTEALGKEIEYVEVEMTFAEFAKQYLGLTDLDTPQSINIENKGILIETFDTDSNVNTYNKMTHFIVKENVDQYYEIKNNEDIIEVTVAHEVYNKKTSSWQSADDLYLANDPNVTLKEGKMTVVDCSVDETENYIANGQINHNTTPGGKSTKFAASVRIKLLGRKPVVIGDPAVEAEWQEMLKEYGKETDRWKAADKIGAKPMKPKKPKGDEVIIGYDVNARTEKNKVGPPKREAYFRIMFTQGIQEEEAWFDYCIKYNLVRSVTGTTYEIVNHPELGTFRKSQWTEQLADVEIHKELEEALVSKLVRSTNISSSELSEDEETEETETAVVIE